MKISNKAKDILRSILSSTALGIGWAIFIVIVGAVLKVATLLFLLGWNIA